MRTIRYSIDGRVTPQLGATYVDDGRALPEQVAEDVVGAISTDVDVEIGGVTVFLAMLLDPEHWESDWRERDVDDVDEFLSGLVAEQA